MAPKSASVVVVGGGLFGGSAAFQLARSGVQTTLIEPDDFGSHASGNNPGNLNPVHGTPSMLIPLARRSFDLHRVLAAELAGLGCTDLDLQPVRRILLAFDDQDRQALDHAAQAFASIDGFSVTPMDADALLRREPRLSHTLRAGLMIEGNLSVNSGALNRGLARGAARFGATLMRSRVVNVETTPGRIVAVRTAHGPVACDAVVFATGAWVESPDRWLNFDSQVTPVKGEMLRVNLPGPALAHDYTRGLISLYRRGRDECWIGVTQAPAQLDETPTDAGREQLLESAAALFPSVRRATVLGQSASVRPMRPLGLPLIGRVPGWDNAYLANGGGSKGVLLSTGVGLAISELLMTGTTDLPVDAFAPRDASR